MHKNDKNLFLPKNKKPTSESELLSRARQLRGKTLSDITTTHHIQLPKNLQTHKGWVGHLAEWLLGATAGSLSEPDFVDLGIELKTLPISQQGIPLETTFVCIAPLGQTQGITWETSLLKKKLNKVLWLPIISERSIPLAERMIATPFLWQPSLQQIQVLQQDWEELMELIVLGDVRQITAKSGEWLQLRPKGANKESRTQAIGVEGNKIHTLPKAFYLRKEFTQWVLAEAFNE